MKFKKKCVFLFLFADIDNNGFLDQNDFECMALRACIIEGKGDCTPAKLSEYQHIMRSLWDEISDLADFDKVRNKVKRVRELNYYFTRFYHFPMNTNKYTSLNK